MGRGAPVSGGVRWRACVRVALAPGGARPGGVPAREPVPVQEAERAGGARLLELDGRLRGAARRTFRRGRRPRRAGRPSSTRSAGCCTTTTASSGAMRASASRRFAHDPEVERARHHPDHDDMSFPPITDGFALDVPFDGSDGRVSRVPRLGRRGRGHRAARRRRRPSSCEPRPLRDHARPGRAAR